MESAALTPKLSTSPSDERQKQLKSKSHYKLSSLARNPRAKERVRERVRERRVHLALFRGSNLRPMHERLGCNVVGFWAGDEWWKRGVDFERSEIRVSKLEGNWSENESVRGVERYGKEKRGHGSRAAAQVPCALALTFTASNSLSKKNQCKLHV